MGLKSSKEKSKLPRRLSSRRRLKRLSPDGTPSCVERSTAPTSGCRHTSCPCSKDPLASQYGDPVKPGSSVYHQNSNETAGLRVSLPSDDIGQAQSTANEPRNVSNASWKVTFETKNKKLSDLMTSLQPHIQSVEVDGEVGKGNITVRFRDSIDFSNALPNESSTPPQETSTHDHPCRIGRTARDRLQHYEQIPGASEKRQSIEEESSQKTAGKRTKSRSRSRELQSCRHNRCCANQTSGKSSRYQSPFDQRSFQEAMLLRLTELQRKSAIHARAACQITNSNDSSDTDIWIRDETDSEYSGDDDSSITQSTANRNCSRLFEPLSSLESYQRRGLIDVEANVETTSGIERRCNVGTSTSNDTAVVKPWDKETAKRLAGKKKTFTKKRSHGYLRASAAIRKDDATFPNTPKASCKNDDIKPVQRHRHEHIHHHFYYNVKPHK